MMSDHHGKDHGHDDAHGHESAQTGFVQVLIDASQMVAAAAAGFFGANPFLPVTGVEGEINGQNFAIILILVSVILTSLETDKKDLRVLETLLGGAFILFTIMDWSAFVRVGFLVLLIIFNGGQILWMPLLNKLHSNGHAHDAHH